MKIEDIAIAVFLLTAFAILLWLLHGSPLTENALIGVGTLIISTQFMFWKGSHEVDKKAAVSFTKFKGDIEHIKVDLQEIKQRQGRMEEKLDRVLHHR